ncbi:hypothetical protein PR048_019352 [Dryococelus australis]|uniref:Uncharacterized protein n=1 Tax=Dryococelus australis TaxID=614101 RepID=A0ABQ9H3K7_9NEOP|nr:hypothetical protein PR048_019352 [Dryococelus australis]
MLSQDEIQSAHWSHAQVTVFTCCIWISSDVKTYAIISDDLSHMIIGINDCEWNYFASSHGKGTVDGIERTVKRCVWTGVKSRRAEIQTAEKFHEYVEEHLNGVKCAYVSKEAVEPHIQTSHHFRLYSLTDLRIAKS